MLYTYLYTSLTLKNSEDIDILRKFLEEKSWVHKINIVSSGNNYAAMTRMMDLNNESKLIKRSDKKSFSEDSTEKQLQFDGEICPKCLNLLLDNGGHRIPEIVKIAEEAGVILDSVELRKPTLDDVFLSVTGKNIRDQEGSFIDMVRRFRIMRQARR